MWAKAIQGTLKTVKSTAYFFELLYLSAWWFSVHSVSCSCIFPYIFRILTSALFAVLPISVRNRSAQSGCVFTFGIFVTLIFFRVFSFLFNKYLPLKYIVIYSNPPKSQFCLLTLFFIFMSILALSYDYITFGFKPVFFFFYLLASLLLHLAFNYISIAFS